MLLNRGACCEYSVGSIVSNERSSPVAIYMCVFLRCLLVGSAGRLDTVFVLAGIWRELSLLTPFSFLYVIDFVCLVRLGRPEVGGRLGAPAPLLTT